MQLAFVPPGASPIRRQYLALKRQHPNAILFFQLGDFYETFEEDARIVAEVCEVALTSREMGRGERLPMAGVPVHSAEPYIARLVERGYHIAICEQVEPAGSREGIAGRTATQTSRLAPHGSSASLVHREITRVITPGTLVDPPLLTATRANYLAAIAVERHRTGIAHADITTGEFACAEIGGPDHREVARAELWRIQPAECLLADAAGAESLVPTGVSTTIDQTLFSTAEMERALCAHFGVGSIAALGLADCPSAALATAAILRYLGRTQPRAGAVVERIRLYDVHGHMVIDPATRDHLEIVRGPKGRREGSLLQTLDRTRTAMGARLLTRWVGHPLLDRSAILQRLDAVSAFMEHGSLRQDVQTALARLPDLERLAGRAAQRLLTPREALALADGVAHAAGLRTLLAEVSTPDARLDQVWERVDPPAGVADDIRSTLSDSPPSAFGEGIIRSGRIPELDDLRSHSKDGRQRLLDLERRERERTGLKSLKVGYNRVFGYYLEVTAASLRQPVDYYRQTETGAKTVADLLERLGYQRRQTLATAERFVISELREHEVQEARAASRMADLEREAYEDLCKRIGTHARKLLSTGAALAEIDVLASYAQLAEEQRYVRPEILDEPTTEILGGRHPVVEAALGWDAYIPADAHLVARADAPPGTEPAATLSSLPGPSVIVLTGPNMAGKTTYGRMVLLVTLMAQCGSFVPAEAARIGMVDQIFLRSGAGDDIAGGRSTFMVEMTETAAILRNVTFRSLAFFDEVGRGTSTYDGMAIARAIVEYLASAQRGCRTIFSTHYHELAVIQDEQPTVGNYRMEVAETVDHVSFTYRVVPGSADRSYGVHVAWLAGLPSEVVARAGEVLAELEAGGDEQRAAPGQQSERAPTVRASSLTGVPPIVYDLADVDPNQTTPLEALHTLASLHLKARRWLSSGGLRTEE